MRGRDLVLAALKKENTPRAPWVPFTGVHCAKMINIDAETFLKNADKIVEGVKVAARKYNADGVCSLFDLQMEAEVLGCSLKWATKNPPSISSHILETRNISDLPNFTSDLGRIPIALEATNKLVNDFNGECAVWGLACGPFTLAIHLAGTDMIMYMIREPEKAFEILEYCAHISKKMTEWYISAGADVVALVDPMTSQISPKHFRKYVSPYVQPSINQAHKMNSLITLFCCGNATKNIESMMECLPDGIAFDEQVSVAFCKELSLKHNVAIQGNLHLTTTLLFGSPTECVEDAKTCLREGGTKGFILSPGCDLPFDTPEYNLEAIGRYGLYGTQPSKTAGFVSLAEALANCDMEAEGFEEVEIPSGNLFVEVVTLDSEGCAPCQYMMEALTRITHKYQGKLRYREVLIKNLAGIKRMEKLGVKNLPSMLINNELVFDNVVPTDEELIQELDKRM